VPQTVRFVRIEGDRVTQVKIAALGQPIAIHTENELQGYLDPEDTHELAMGDTSPGSTDSEGRPAAKPPTILKPGEAGAGASQRVQYPVAAKEQPLPAAPGSPADDGGTIPDTTQSPASTRSHTASTIPDPSVIPDATHYSDASETRVN
jgi:hypothetical protein